VASFNKALFPYLQKKACIRTACSLIDTCDCESNEGIKEGREMDHDSFSGSGFYVMFSDDRRSA